MVKKVATAYITPKDFAAAVGVSESTAKRWVDDERISAVRTRGGHRRIEISEALRFVRSAGLRVENLGSLGLAEICPDQESSALIEKAGERGASQSCASRSGLDADELFAAFLTEEWRLARGMIVRSFILGAEIGPLCDGPIRQALERVGELWRRGAAGILIEHRAVDTCLQALSIVRSLLPSVPETAPVAVGGAVAEDPYVLPSLMAAVVLAEVGFREVNLGPMLPTDALVHAVERYQPRLVWRTASVVMEGGSLPRDLAAIRAGARAETKIALGGRGVSSSQAELPSGVYRLGSMAELAGFARGLVAAGAENVSPA